MLSSGKYLLKIVIRSDSIRRSCYNFGAAMSEALQEHKEKCLKKTTANHKQYKSRYNGRHKKRQWQDYNSMNQDDEAIQEKRANFDPADRIKKKKMVLLLGYSGVNYYGMQRNPGQKTIEEDLLTAMLKNEWIDQDAFNQVQNVHFQRAARTDKGVSAARQICSIKLPSTIDLEALNRDLPKQIRVFATKRVTKGFNAKDQCDARTYSYTLPTISFAHYTDDTVNLQSFRANPDLIARLNVILKLYHGTKNFHNFTCKKEFHDPSSKRFIISFECSVPFLSDDNIEFATLNIKGQSFMMHQIRKMVGLTLAVLRGHTTTDTIDRAFTKDRLDIPMAPGLGLVLNQVHYDRYNNRYGTDGVHEPLTWDGKEPEIQDFIKEYINSTIYKTEFHDQPMIAWLETLGFHTYDIRTNEDQLNTINEIEKSSSDNNSATAPATETSNVNPESSSII